MEKLDIQGSLKNLKETSVKRLDDNYDNNKFYTKIREIDTCSNFILKNIEDYKENPNNETFKQTLTGIQEIILKYLILLINRVFPEENSQLNDIQKRIREYRNIMIEHAEGYNFPDSYNCNAFENSSCTERYLRPSRRINETQQINSEKNLKQILKNGHKQELKDIIDEYEKGYIEQNAKEKQLSEKIPIRLNSREYDKTTRKKIKEYRNQIGARHPPLEQIFEEATKIIRSMTNKNATTT